MARISKTARLFVNYGKFKQGELVRGDLAAKLIDDGMAADVTPKKKTKGPAPENKAKTKAPENKDFEV